MTDIHRIGNLTTAGVTYGSLIMRPVLDVAKYIGGTSKPTYVTRGAVGGFSFPIYASDNEEIFLRDIIPGRALISAGATLYTWWYLAGAEDVNDKFKIQASWYLDDGSTGTTADTTTDPDTETTITTDHSAQYSNYTVAHTITLSGGGSRYPINFRIRRIAASANEISNEVVLKNWAIKYTVNRVYSTV